MFANNYYRNPYSSQFWGGRKKNPKYYDGHPDQIQEDGYRKSKITGAKGAFFKHTNAKGEVVKIFRFIEGATPEYLAGIRQLRGQSPRKPITQRGATRAFNKYYTYSPNGRWASPRGAKLAKTYDLNRGPKRPEYLVNDRRYLRNPGKYDFDGVDNIGTKAHKMPSAKQLDNLRKGRAMSPRGKAKSPSRQPSRQASSASSTASTASAYGGLWNRYY